MYVRSHNFSLVTVKSDKLSKKIKKEKMRFTYNQYNYYESGYRIPSKMHHSNHNSNNNNNNSSSNNSHNLSYSSSNSASNVHHPHHYKSNFGMRTTMSTMSTMSPRIHRKGFRTPSKRHPGKAFPGKLHSVSRIGPGKMVPGKRFPIRPHPPPCDNSNDSGFGFDQHVEVQQQHSQQQQQQSGSPNSSTNSSNSSSSSLQLHNHQISLHSQQSSMQSSPSSLNSSSSPTSSSTSSSLATSLQHSPQQHLIRAIPASRSRHAKKLPFLNDDTENTESEDEDFCTDDSDDNYGGRHRKNLKMTNQQIISSSSSSSSSCSSSTSSPHSDKYNHHQNHNYHHMGHGIKRKKIETIEVDLDNDDACSEDAFIRKIASAASTNVSAESEATASSANISVVNTRPAQLQLQSHPHSSSLVAGPATTKFIAASARSMARVAHKRQPATPANSVATSSNGRIQLEILSQPEQQHRARYQTEGSRGAVKDRSGNGFPIVRLVGYSKASTLQVFIGTDIGRVAPHMFYQACKVAGKNSTQCNEKKVDGTVVIEIDFKPDQDMTITCDCVGILKERNVDVEHRFPEHLAQKNKKKSTRCRMVFRTQLTHEDGTVETLQVCSNPIICTQPPGVPEICKKSLNSCPVDGGLELFIIGKNFLKDTHVIFQETYESVNGNIGDDNLNTATASENDMPVIGGALWEQTVLPDKEYLQQTHLICTVPPYIHQNILKPVTVQVAIISSGKKSEPHTFAYTPKGTYTPLAAATTLCSTNTIHSSLSSPQDASFMDTTPAVSVTTSSSNLWPTTETKHEIDADMMPPPTTTQMPMVVRRPSLNTTQPLICDQQMVHLNAVVAAEALKTELLDESSQSSLADAIHSPESVVAVCGVGGPQSPTALQYHSHYGRKANMDAIMYDNNSLQGFPVAPAAPTTTPMEVAVAAAVERAVKNEIAKAVSVAKVDKFITDLATSANVADATDPVQETSLFSVTNSSAISHALTDILTTPQTTAAAAAAAAAVVLERSLSNSSASSSSSSGSPLSVTSPSNSLTSHSSPITQDIILNSEPSIQLTPSLPLQQLLPSGSASTVTVNPEVSQAAGLSTDIIMNPSVSPSTILCSDNGAATAVVPNIMAPHQVTMANSILNDIAMQAQPTQQDAAVAVLALSNIIMTPPSDTTDAVPPTSSSLQPEVTTATSTAVSNMIIKAAADFISNQEQQTQQHHHHCHTTHQSHSPQQQIMASQNVASDPLSSCNPLNLLLNHTDIVPTTQASVTATNGVVNETVSSQFPSLGITTPPQESLIVALATENVLQKSVAAAAITTNGAVVTQETAATSTPNLHPAAAAAVGAVAAAAAAAAVAPLAPIPQDLTTMSDQDLLSYINPSTFDQV